MKRKTKEKIGERKKLEGGRGIEEGIFEEEEEEEGRKGNREEEEEEWENREGEKK